MKKKQILTNAAMALVALTVIAVPEMFAQQDIFGTFLDQVLDKGKQWTTKVINVSTVVIMLVSGALLTWNYVQRQKGENGMNDKLVHFISGLLVVLAVISLLRILAGAI